MRLFLAIFDERPQIASISDAADQIRRCRENIMRRFLGVAVVTLVHSPPVSSRIVKEWPELSQHSRAVIIYQTIRDLINMRFHIGM